MTNKVIGPITIHFPDENEGSFSIFEDCAELFGTEYQSDAYKQLKARLKDVKPKPSMDYEADALSIRSANVETVLAVIFSIAELCQSEHKPAFSELSIESLRNELITAKKNRPKPKPWETGDVFIIPLGNNSYTVGQILDKDYCTCVLFNGVFVNIETIDSIEFDRLQSLSILHLSNGDLLNNGNWKILFNAKVNLDPASGHGGRKNTVGCISYGGCRTMVDLAYAYYGIIPWNVMFEEDYYDKMLLKGITRPSTAKILSTEQRKEYRLKHFNVE